jgi:hypothetical protein
VAEFSGGEELFTAIINISNMNRPVRCHDTAELAKVVDAIEAMKTVM